MVGISGREGTSGNDGASKISGAGSLITPINSSIFSAGAISPFGAFGVSKVAPGSTASNFSTGALVGSPLKKRK